MCTLDRVLPHIANDLDGATLHRTLLLLPTVAAAPMTHFQHVAAACSAVHDHAATIVDSTTQCAVLVHAWKCALAPLCLQAIHLWSTKSTKNKNALSSALYKLGPTAVSVPRTEATTEEWCKEASHHAKRAHGKLVHTCQQVLHLLQGWKEEQETITTAAAATTPGCHLFPYAPDTTRVRLIQQYCVDACISLENVQHHACALRVLQSVVKAELFGSDIRALFLSGEAELFTPEGLDASTHSTHTTSRTTEGAVDPPTWSGLLDASIHSARLQLISDVAVSDVTDALALSTPLEIPKAEGLVECFRVLWCSGQERRALELFQNVDDGIKREAAQPLVDLACEQVDTVLDAMRKDKRYRTLLSTVPAHVYTSIRSSARKARSKRIEMKRKDPTKLKKVSPSLSETHSLLSRLVPVLDQQSSAHSIAVDVAGVVSTLAKRAEQLQQQGKHQKKKTKNRK